MQSTLGELVPGRCKATNLCDYCAKLAAVENAEVLAQDALAGVAPTLWTVTTTRSSVSSMAAYKVARRAVMRAVKGRWPDAERATLVEFTTGMGTRSGGARRPHWNDIWKGIPANDQEQLLDVVAAAWCDRVDAEPQGQYAGTIRECGGLMRYLALHFQKESQQPPKGWRGHRFTTSRGYLGEPMEAARERARHALRLRRELWKAEGQGIEGEEALRVAEARLWDLEQLGWELVRVVQVPATWDDGDLPATWEEEVVPVEPRGRIADRRSPTDGEARGARVRSPARRDSPPAAERRTTEPPAEALPVSLLPSVPTVERRRARRLRC